MGGPKKHRKKLNATINHEGGKNSREQVSSKHLPFGFVLQLYQQVSCISCLFYAE
jgi:hypothetical protein